MQPLDAVQNTLGETATAFRSVVAAAGTSMAIFSALACANRRAQTMHTDDQEPATSPTPLGETVPIAVTVTPTALAPAPPPRVSSFQGHVRNRSDASSFESFDSIHLPAPTATVRPILASHRLQNTIMIEELDEADVFGEQTGSGSSSSEVTLFGVPHP